MKIESLAIGDELMRGEIADTNTAYLGQVLLASDLRLTRAQCLPDDEPAIVECLRAIATRAEAAVVSGGLGPTIDDRTSAAASTAFDRPLELHQPSLDRMMAMFAARGYSFSPNNEKQAQIPSGATVLENTKGTAPGFMVDEGGCQIFFLPGVPREYRTFIDSEVLPRLVARRPAMAVRSRTLRTLGTTESRVDQLLRDLPLAQVRLSTRVEGPETHVVLVSVGTTGAEADAELDRVAGLAGERLGALVYGTGRDTLSQVVGQALVGHGWTLGIAESCTGGLVSAEITNVAGSSRYFKGGIVAYANEAKVALLDVSPDLIARHGAVSAEVAMAMAHGARDRLGCDVGLGVTGIAGPDGGTEEKPVGLVHFAAVGAREDHREVKLPPGRERVRRFASRVALALVLGVLP